MVKKEWISAEGYTRLEDEYHRLIKVERPTVVQQVADAAAEGDRSENAEYIYGKKKMREIDRRLKYLAQRMDRVEMKMPPLHVETVDFLSMVEVENLETDEIKRFQIVGPDESDVKLGKISYLSPIGKAMMGRKVDDDFEFDTPAGKRIYCVNSINLTA
ncbi:MAG: transcription elongation factor GreB [Myxococcales bacterium]|nr:transcription elongation factor GreB [Myxococcales bacterium]